MTEEELISKIREWCHTTHTDRVILGVDDDAAAIRPSSKPLLFCSDLMVEGTHWRAEFSSPEDVGHKALTRSLSDIAAMGGAPLAVTISIVIPETLGESETKSWLTAFYRGACAQAKATHTAIVGGDITRAGQQIVVDIAATGEQGDSLWRRQGARPGDIAYVTGPLGGADAALRALRKGAACSDDFYKAHRRPNPRLDVALALNGGQNPERPKVSAAIDISDGLALDGSRMAKASGVQLVFETKSLPLAECASLEDVLFGGDAYELLLAIPSDESQKLETLQSQNRELRFLRVGRFETGAGVVQENHDGKRIALSPRGHDPFEK